MSGKMLPVEVHNETDILRKVMLGVADDSGNIPDISEAYDPKSKVHILNNQYPSTQDISQEISLFKAILERHGVEVLRPKNVANHNQLFARDVGFVIEDFFIQSNIVPNREKELEGIQEIKKQIHQDKYIIPSPEVHIEGGDVILWKEYIFIGTYYGDDYADYITARTNREAVLFIEKLFPHKKVVGLELVKSNTDPYHNALHLDCCFQPVGVNMAVIHPEGFVHQKDYILLQELFGVENILIVDAEEMYEMGCNFFSISPKVVVTSSHLDRLNDWLVSRGMQVEKTPYREIGKQGGSFRCSTLPLLRS